MVFPLFLKYIKKVVKNLIKISKNEARYLREKGWGRFISISSSTHKGNSKRYWLTQYPRVVDVLEEYRQGNIIERNDL